MAPAPKHSPEQQQQLILDAAIKCIETSSILDFTMSALSKEAGLSMGSIYKHIQTKEDVFVALATTMYSNLHDVFAQILDLPMPFPVRLIALQLTGPDTACCYEFGGHLEGLVSNEVVLQRASTQWLEKMMSADQSVEALVRERIEAAVDSGELNVNASERNRVVEEIIVGIWSMHVGFIQVARQREARHLVGEGIDAPFPLSVDDTIIQAQKHFLNTYPWQEPITNEMIRQACDIMVQHKLR